MSPALVPIGFAAAGALFLLAALALGAAAWLRGALRWLLLGRGKAALSSLRDREGDVVIEGALRGAPSAGPALLATAVPPADRSLVPGAGAVNAAAPEVWIEMADGAVLVSAAAVVAAGSRELSAGTSQPAVKRALGDIAADLCALDGWQVRCLRGGDRVIASGRVERAPDLPGPAGYRTQAVRHRLFGARPSARIVVMGARPPRPFVAPRRKWAAAFLCVLAAGLQIALPKVFPPPPLPAPPRGPDEIALLMAQNRYEEAATVAEAKLDYSRAGHAYFLSGDLGRAAKMFALAHHKDEWPPSQSELDAYIVAQDWEHASEAAEAIGGKLYVKDRKRADDLLCFSRVLHFAEPQKEVAPVMAPYIFNASDLSDYVCPLAFADVFRTRYAEELLTVYHFWGPFGIGNHTPPEPSDTDADARVAALLQRERGVSREWQFTLPHATHALRAQKTMFRMPLFGLDRSAAEKSPVSDTAELVERTAMSAVWRSVLGDHEAAARTFREALVRMDLEAAAPPMLGQAPQPSPPHTGSLRGAAAFRSEKAIQLFALGAALGVRAGDGVTARAYADLVPPEQDYSGVRRYMRALNREGRDFITDLWDIEDASRHQLLVAARRDDISDLRRALDGADGQGLWQILAPELKAARPAAISWLSGEGATACDGCGLYDLLARYAAMRAAAQALGATPQERRLAARIEKLSAPLFDRRVAVLLYVSGRLAPRP